MEKEEGHLPFLDIDIYRKTDGSLGHKVYRKSTHTNLYLHQNSHHHPTNKQSVLSSPDTQNQSPLWPGFPPPRTRISHHPLQGQWIQSSTAKRAMKPATRTAKTDDKPTSTTYIPYTQTTFGRLSRMLAKHNIKSVALPPKKIFSYLPPVKDALRTPGIYNIPCECGKVYIGQSGRSVQLRISTIDI